MESIIPDRTPVDARYLADSGWQTLSLGSQFAAYNQAYAPRYRKIGYTVHVVGIITPTQTIAGGYTEYTMFTLPADARPAVPVYTICQGSGGYVWLFCINTNGVATFSRYRNYGTNWINAEAGNWFPFSATFMTA